MTTEVTAVVVSVAFWVTMVGLMVFREIQHDREIRLRDKFNGELLNRLMARDWNEYRAAQAPPPREMPIVTDEMEARLAAQWAADMDAQRKVLDEEKNQGISVDFS